MDEYRENILKIKSEAALDVSRKIDEAGVEISKLEKKDFAFSNSRLAAFTAMVVLVWMGVYHDEANLIVSAAFLLAAFVALMYRHGFVIELLEYKRAEKILLIEKKSRIEEDVKPHKNIEKHIIKETSRHEALHGSLNDITLENSYELNRDMKIDLDLFDGEQNLFSQYNTAQTSIGIKKFCNYLQTPLLDAALLKERQKAVSELIENNKYVHELMICLHKLRGVKFSEFVEATAAKPVLPHNFFFRNLLFVTSISAILSIIFQRFELFAVLYGFNFAMIAMFFNKCSAIKKNYLSMATFAPVFSKLSKITLEAGFESKILKKLSLKLAGRKIEDQTADQGKPFYKKLESISNVAGLMLIPMPVILDAVILSELILCERIERKVKNISEELFAFIDAAGELEALSAMANIAIDSPEYNFPKIIENGPVAFYFDALTHPFIPFGRAVENSLKFDENLNIAIITGSNMSGKSTFLKSAAIAVILSLIGAPARAKSAAITPLHLTTDIRIMDSIKEGVSYFYSELLRVKAVTDILKETKSVFGIFDELFHGTNSRERLALCRASMEYLKDSGGKFIIATHDRELTSFSDIDKNNKIGNFHFDEKLEGLESVFTYKLVTGPSGATNAIKLAHKCGLPEAIYKKAEDALKMK